MAEAFWSPVRLSLQIASLSTILVVIIGVWIGFRMARSNHRFKIVLDTLFFTANGAAANGNWFFSDQNFWEKHLDWSDGGRRFRSSDYVYLVGRSHCMFCCIISAYVPKCKSSL